MKKSVQLFRSSAKSKKLFISLLVICIVLISVLFYSSGIFYVRLKKWHIFSIVALVGMFILLSKAFSNLNAKNPLLELNSKDFYGKTTSLSKSFGLVDWKDVVEIKLIKLGVDTFVVVFIDNCQKYEGRLSPSLWDIAFNKDTNQISLMYSAYEIGIQPDELFKLLNKFWLDNNN